MSLSSRRKLGVGLLCFGVLDLALIHGVIVPRWEQERGRPVVVATSTPIIAEIAPSPVPAAPPPAPAVPVPAVAPSAPAAPVPVVAAVAPAPPVPREEPSPAPKVAAPAPVAVAPAAPKTDFAPIRFAPKAAWVSPQAKQALIRLANVLREHPSLRVVLVGHTDDVGSEQYNFTLSQERARRSQLFLESRGIAPERIRIEGLGSTRPVDDKNTPLARARNRRVEITVR